MNAVYLLSIILISIGITLVLLIFVLEDKKNHLLKKRKCNEYAILIPARYESKVIRNLLDSIKIQNDNMNNVYLIIESKKDETYNIAKEYGANIYIRRNIGHRKRKGFALDEAIKSILKNKKYDLYFIFDADNVLDKHFIKHMIKSYEKGYDIALGYRNIKTCTNVISACSGLTFSFINTIGNKRKMLYNKAMIISGTGYYISGNLINKWKGFPFNSLTEDYELSLYAESSNITTCYNEQAIFYDEQPTSMKVSIKQRTRWVKGFLESRSIRLKDIRNDYEHLIGIFPYLIIILGVILYFINSIFYSIYFYFINSPVYIMILNNLILTIIIVYLALSIITAYVLIKEKSKINIKTSIKIKAILFNPIFLITYINCFIKAISHKEITWETIEHKENIAKA